MGNPASVTRKKTEKRRKKYETRLGAGVYLPKDERLKVNEAVAKDEAAEKARLAQVVKDREARRAKKAAEKKAKAAAPPAAAPAEEKK
jgi:hypothetical protein